MKKRILIVVGTRPNFIKITQFPAAIMESSRLECKIVHTGQHFHDAMSTVFFRQFNMQPDLFLKTEHGTVVSQMANIMLELEKAVNEYKPDLMIVPGDVNSTLAAALTANKMNIPLAHLEAGLRSHDRTMPEEFNRLLADEMADVFFVTEQSGYDNLLKEGHDKGNIYMVGNTMIDAMVAFAHEIDKCPIVENLNLETKKYVLMTMHRPATVDSAEGLTKLIRVIEGITEKFKLVFPVHPRTVKNLESMGFYTELKKNKNIILCEPLDYFSFQKLIKEALLIVTDSGGIQEESTFRGIPCFTLRPNTERPSTVSPGTNELVPFDKQVIDNRIIQVVNGTYKKGAIPPLWDGNATKRIVKILEQILA